MRSLKAFLKGVDAVNEWFGGWLPYLILPTVALMAMEVILRYVFNHPTMWSQGMSQRLMAVYYVLGGGYILCHNDHIKVDLIYNSFSLRTKAILDLITSPCFFAFCGVLLWKGLGFGMTSLIQLEPDETPWRAPIYPIKLMIPVGAFLILLQGVANFVRNLITAITGR